MKDGVRYCITSETTALQMIGFEFVRDVKPAELIWIDSSGNIQLPFVKVQQSLLCLSGCTLPAPTVSSRQVGYTSRLALGKRLADKVQDMMTDRLETRYCVSGT